VSNRNLVKKGNVVECNIEVCMCNHCYSGKGLSITYCEFVFVALGILHAMRMPYIVICGLSESAIYFLIIS
jgi:hypothetical protein